MTRRNVAWATAVLMLAGCTQSPSPPRPQTPSYTAATHAAGQEVTDACARPTATAQTDHGMAVGSRSAPTIGPLSFHPYRYAAGYPTKVILHAVRDQTQTIVLRGSRCGDGRPLRFWYDDGILPGPLPPLTEQQMQGVGDLATSLVPTAANIDHLGYMLFSSPGRWEVTVTQNSTDLGVLLVDVAQP